MNTKLPPKSAIRRTQLRSIFAFLAATLACTSSVSAADWYLNKDQAHPTDWNKLSDWNSEPNGSGTTPTALFLTDTYHCNVKDLRSPYTAGTSSFPGGLLVIESPSTALYIKASPGGGIIVPKLLTTAGAIFNYSGGLVTLGVGEFENRTGSTDLSATSGFSLKLDADKLIGSGTTRLTGGGTFLIDVTDATSYLGELYVQQGTVDFENDFSSAGKLTIESTAKVALDQDVVFTALTIAGSSKAVGTYDYATLHAEYPAIFASGSGTITVRPPLTWYLSTSQSSGSDWNTLAHWKSNANGTGVTADSVNLYDTYSNQASGRILRTPTTTSMFGGDALRLSAGGSLQLCAPAGQVSTVPVLVTSGATTISSGLSGAAQLLEVSAWATTAGSTTISTTSGGVLDVAIHDLTGYGDWVVSGSGQLRPWLTHANHFTGTITVNAGATLTVQTTLATAGALVVNAGGNVTLNDWAYFTSLTVNDVLKPAGTYTAASFGWSGTGSITVYSTALVDSPQLFGVNLAGAEFDGGAQWQTNPAVWDYYQAKGLTLIRLPVKWNRIQSALYGTVDFTQMDACVALAAARDMKVIIDLHNYAAYADGKNPPRLGSASLPISAMVDVWSKIADHYKNEPTIYGYDLMNEPKDISISVWTEAAQLSMDAIRKKDTTHFVLVEGIYWSNAYNWAVNTANNATLDIKDPVGRLIYSAHSYWDYKSNVYANPPYYGSDGIYRIDDVPSADIGVNHVAPFVNWLKTRPYAYGNVGEYAVPNDNHSSDWNVALGNFLQYLRDNNMGGTYWAGGNNWQPSATVCNPQPAITSPDKPQMAVLQSFGNLPSAVEVIVDNTTGGGAVVFSPTGTTAWGVSSASPGYYGTDYRHDQNAAKGTKTVTFTPDLATAGYYEVFVRWTANSNRATNVPVSVTTLQGTVAAQSLDQTVNGGEWNSIGVYEFAAGTSGSVMLSNTGTNGYVVADAVKFTPAGSAIMVDDTNASAVILTGSWGTSSSASGYIGSGYLHDGNAGKGTKAVTFTPFFATAGNYEVWVNWTSEANRATNVPVSVHTPGGTVSAPTLDQTVNGGVWNSIGTYAFGISGADGITISNTGTNGYVIVDAVKFTPAGSGL